TSSYLISSASAHSCLIIFIILTSIFPSNVGIGWQPILRSKILLHSRFFGAHFYQSINKSSLTSVSSSEDNFGDALSSHSKIHKHHPCDEITDTLRDISVPVP